MSVSILRRAKTDLNPDDDFVLQGKHSSYWEKPGYVKNSELTTTSSRLSQHSLFNPDSYRDRKYTHSLSDLAHNLESLSKEVKQSLDKSVTTDNLRQTKSLQESLRTDITEDELMDNGYYNREGNSLNRDESHWCVSPRVSTRSSRVLTPHKVSSGTIGSVLSMEQEDRARKAKILQKYPLSRSESEALTYFPSTLGSSYELEKLDYLLSKTSPVHMSSKVRPKTATGVTRKSKSVTLREPVEDYFDEKQNVNKLYLMTSEAPTIGSAPAMITSPYDIELAQLRMERLRIEEDRLLEMKRLSELERIRGPKPKWYESKGPDFYYESHKNTAMLKHQKHWEDLMSYRNELVSSSVDCKKSYDNIYRDL